MSVEVGGQIAYTLALMPLSVALATGVASVLLRFLVGTRHRYAPAARAAVGMGVAICAVHYVGRRHFRYGWEPPVPPAAWRREPRC